MSGPQPEISLHLENAKDDTERLLALVGVVDVKVQEKLAELSSAPKERIPGLRRECDELARLKIDVMKQVRETILLTGRELEREIRRVADELTPVGPGPVKPVSQSRHGASHKHKKKKNKGEPDSIEKGCPCGQIDNPSPQVQCEKCLFWYHTDCAGLTPEAMPADDSPWFCEGCGGISLK